MTSKRSILLVIVFLYSCNSGVKSRSKNTNADSAVTENKNDSLASLLNRAIFDSLVSKYKPNDFIDRKFGYFFQLQDAIDSNRIIIIELNTTKYYLHNIIRDDSIYKLLINDYMEERYQDWYDSEIHQVYNYELTCNKGQLYTILQNKERNPFIITAIKNVTKIKYALVPNVNSSEDSEPTAEIEVDGSASYIFKGDILEIINKRKL